MQYGRVGWLGVSYSQLKSNRPGVTKATELSLPPARDSKCLISTQREVRPRSFSSEPSPKKKKKITYKVVHVYAVPYVTHTHKNTYTYYIV